MSDRSLIATPEGIQQAKIELKGMRLTQKQLAERLQITRQPVSHFLNGKPVSNDLFVNICETLKLDWKVVCGLPKNDEVPDLTQNPDKKMTQGTPELGEVEEDCIVGGTSTAFFKSGINEAEIDALVQNIHDAMRPTILEKCGKIKILNMEHPIGVDDIYTNVNILEKMTRYREIDLIKMMQEASSEEVERFSFGAVKDKPISGLEAVERYNKLMIFGKPGAGKTTFLKHLAMQCIGGEFQAHRIPVFVELNEFAKTEGHPNLTDYIHRIITTCIEVPLKEVFDTGRLLILLDGLDEVNETDISRVLPQIKKFAEQPHGNQYVITCRIAALEFTFDQFFEVEVSDFGKDEIKHFSRKFFNTKNNKVNAENFIQKLEDNPAIQELAKSPLLLAMLCSLFKENVELTENRSDLYERGIDILLKKWDKKKLGIKRRQIHKNLSIEQKKNILSQIAWKYFEAGNYFFKQRDLENQVRKFFENEFQTNTHDRDSDVDYEDVLDLFESHHGLLIKRAQKIYSFSHLIFHEYFVAREIASKSNYLSFEDPFLNEAVNHLTDKRWRDVFLLITQMLPRADEFIKIIHSKIKFLQSSNSNINYLVNLVFHQYPDIQSIINIKGLDFTSEDQARSCWHIIRSLSFGSVIELVHDVSLLMSFYDSQMEVSPLALKVEFILNSDKYEKYKFNEKYAKLAILLDENVGKANVKTIDSIADLPIFSELKILFPEGFVNGKYREILRFYPLFNESETYSEWWKKNQESWRYDVKNFIARNREILQSLSFSDVDLIALRQYYYANTLLVNCLKLPGISMASTLKEEIEHDLLLPIFEAGK